MEKANRILDEAVTIATARSQMLHKEHILDVALRYKPVEYFLKAGVPEETIKDLRKKIYETIKNLPRIDREKAGQETEEVKELLQEIFKFSEPEDMPAEEFVVRVLNSRIIHEAFRETESIGIKVKKYYEYTRQQKEKQEKKSKEKIKANTGIFDEDEDFREKSFLKTYGRNLTELARKRKIQRAYEREKIINKIIITLNRQNKSNVLLVGHPGVGKTAIVEELAFLSLSHPVLSKYTIYEVKISELVAGSIYRGQFEKKLAGILKEAESEENVILFIDEIHTVMGAGDGSGATSAESILKPYLARGGIKLIGATTFAEAEKIYRDKAFARRFVKVVVPEPSEKEVKRIISMLINDFSKLHQVEYSKNLEELIYRLGKEYMPSRHFPDKAVDIVDIAGAIAKIKQENVTEDTIYEAASELSGIDVAIIKGNGKLKEKIRQINESLKERVYGQEEAVKAIVKNIERKLCGKMEKPLAMIFTGPSGVGKTYTAKLVAELLEFPVLKLDMSNYYDKHTISSLIGSPAGYRDSERDGILTAFIKENPLSVVIMDEMEKADPAIYNLLLAALDGEIRNMYGETISTKNVIFLLTSNLTANTKNIGFAETDKRKEFLKFIPREVLRRIDDVIEFENVDIYKNLK